MPRPTGSPVRSAPCLSPLCRPVPPGASQFALGYAYDPPPKGNFNFLGGVSGQINLGYLGDLFMLPGATYLRAAQEWMYLLADDTSNLSSDGHTFTYVVRKGLTWSDGTAVTVQDVYTTWLLRWAGGHPVFDYVDTFEVTDEQTVTFHIGTPAPVSEYYLLRGGSFPTRFTASGASTSSNSGARGRRPMTRTSRPRWSR